MIALSSCSDSDIPIADLIGPGDNSNQAPFILVNLLTGTVEKHDNVDSWIHSLRTAIPSDFCPSFSCQRNTTAIISTLVISK